ncbi:MAG: hypothetical protein IPH12_05615 [Saprospirales bacterium]|nr:hypothetical protein [Saprospirales bacterium]
MVASAISSLLPLPRSTTPLMGVPDGYCFTWTANFGWIPAACPVGFCMTTAYQKPIRLDAELTVKVLEITSMPLPGKVLPSRSALLPPCLTGIPVMASVEAVSLEFGSTVWCAPAELISPGANPAVRVAGSFRLP